MEERIQCKRKLGRKIMFSRNEIIVWIFVAFVGVALAYSCRLEAMV